MKNILEIANLLEMELENCELIMRKVIASMFKEVNGKIIILLIGGDKSSQQDDIEKAKNIWDNLSK